MNLIHHIIATLQDNHEMLLTANKVGNYEEVIFCEGYKDALILVLSFFGISYKEALKNKDYEVIMKRE